MIAPIVNVPELHSTVNFSRGGIADAPDAAMAAPAQNIAIFVNFIGLSNEKNKGLLDLNRREQWTLIPLVIIAFWIGLYPKPFFDRMAPTVDRVLERVSVAMPELETAADHVADIAHEPAPEAAGEHGE